ncbi:MAG: putative DNA-binding domain-containing protein [Fluviicola sp.]|nr:putative DNA-binding domain-containing protein [Fluviicola sp.]
MNNPPIEQLQNWFKTILVGKGYLPEKLARAEAFWQLNPSIVKGSENVSIETRIGIYTNGYMLRLLECMQADLPSLYAFWGNQLFDLFGRAYLLQHPSKSPSLFDLTANYADFLDQTRPPSEGLTAEENIQYDLPAALVRMERARLAALLSKGTEGENRETSLGFFSFFSGEAFVLKSHPALQLQAHKMPLIALYRQLMLEQEPTIPSYQPTFLAATRLHFKIQFYELTEWQFALLTVFQKNETGLAIHDAVHEVSTTLNIDKATLLSEACLWLPVAIDMGLLID